MLLEFSVRNFRSIKDQQVFSMVATGERSLAVNKITLEKYRKINSLNSAVLFGANGSGKSNLIRAFDMMKYLAFFSDRNGPKDRIHPYMPYKLGGGILDREPTEMELEFLDNRGVRYLYSFSFNADEFLRESLYYYPRVKETKIFERIKGKEIDFGELKGPKKKIEGLLEKNQLFLTKAAKSQNQEIKHVYNTIAENFEVINSEDHLYKGVDTLKFIDKSESNKEIIKALLKAADISIEDIIIRRINIDESKLGFLADAPKEIKAAYIESASLEVKFKHTVYNEAGERTGFVEFGLEDESDGTRKLFNLSANIIQALEKGRTLFIDEINYGLHPVLGLFIVDLFHNKEINKNNAQLVFTTHDVNFLDRRKFRRDQIWFIEKNKKGESSIYSMSEFDEDKRLQRKSVSLKNWYLSGRFGAIPQMKELFLKRRELTNAKA